MGEVVAGQITLDQAYERIPTDIKDRMAAAK